MEKQLSSCLELATPTVPHFPKPGAAADLVRMDIVVAEEPIHQHQIKEGGYGLGGGGGGGWMGQPLWSTRVAPTPRASFLYLLSSSAPQSCRSSFRSVPGLRTFRRRRYGSSTRIERCRRCAWPGRRRSPGSGKRLPPTGSSSPSNRGRPSDRQDTFEIAQKNKELADEITRPVTCHVRWLGCDGIFVLDSRSRDFYGDSRRL